MRGVDTTPLLYYIWGEEQEKCVKNSQGMLLMSTDSYATPGKMFIRKKVSVPKCGTRGPKKGSEAAERIRQYRLNRPDAAELARKGGLASWKNHTKKKVVYVPMKRILTDVLIAKCPEDPRGRTNIQILMDKVYNEAVKGTPWAVNFIAERVEGRVPYVVKSDSRRPYEELDDTELKRTLADRLGRLRRIVAPTG